MNNARSTSQMMVPYRAVATNLALVRQIGSRPRTSRAVGGDFPGNFENIRSLKRHFLHSETTLVS